MEGNQFMWGVATSSYQVEGGIADTTGIFLQDRNMLRKEFLR